MYSFLDLDECTLHKDICHKNADCVNVIGSYKCQCVTGFNGNGFNCTGKHKYKPNKVCNGWSACKDGKKSLYVCIYVS